MRILNFLILLSLCLFGTLAHAQDPAEFSNYEEEQHLLDSIYRSNPEISRQEVRNFWDDYYRRLADTYYQSYRRRLKRQEEDKDLSSKYIQNQAVTQKAVANNTSSEGQVPDAIEYIALKSLYDSTGGINWRYKDNWLQGTTNSDFATWYGITVENGDVTEIEISYNNLIGTLPHEIGNLSSLRWLSLYYNQLTSLPPEFGDLKSLQNIYLSDNQLTTLPHEINKLSSVGQIVLRNNQLTSLPTQIGDLPNLQGLQLANNQLKNIPPEIINLPKLNYLDLTSNNLTTLLDFTEHPEASDMILSVRFNNLNLTEIAKNISDPKFLTKSGI